MHACMPPHCMPLGILVPPNALLHVSLFVDRFQAIFTLHTGRMFTHATEGPWKTRALGGRDTGIPPFKTPTLNKGTLRPAEIMRDCYRPKMLLYALDEIFFIYAQIRDSPQDERVMLAYKILCISSIRCTNRQNGVEQTGVPDTVALLNTEDARHLKHLAWAIYDGTLLVGPWPELSGTWPWCTVLAGLQQHIYRGHNDVAHCLPQTLGSWDHEEWVQALCCVGSLGG